MNNNLTKLITSAAVVLAMSLNAAARQPAPVKASPSAPFEQGYGIANGQFPAAYNAPARINVQQGWDFYFTGSFTYWDVNEIGFDLGTKGISENTKVLFQDNQYSPGFKIGAGMGFDYDNWVGFVEYTWLRNHSSRTLSFPTFKSYNLVDSSGGVPIDCSRHISLDMVDVTLSRPFYEGKRVTMSPYSGIRGAFLRQKFHALETSLSDSSHSNSWAWLIGPSAGVAAHWLIGGGVRLEGDLGAAILFQQYETNFRLGSTSYTTEQKNRLAPIADIGVGLGWGTYLNCQKAHLDIAATYDFMNWWGQNLIRAAADLVGAKIGGQAGDLQISGLTLTGRFDF